MRIILLLLIIILVIDLVAIILYNIKYLLIISFGDFMGKLRPKLYYVYGKKYLPIIDEYESVLGKYSSEYDHGIVSFFVYLLTAIEIAILIPSILLQICKNCCKFFRGVLSLLLLFICIVYRVLVLIQSFKIKNKLNMTDEEIYIFDSSFNNEIKENLQIMYDRKTYLIVCCFFAIVGMSSQFALIIVDLVKFKKNEPIENNNNIITNERRVIAIQDSERPNLEKIEISNKM